MAQIVCKVQEYVTDVISSLKKKGFTVSMISNKTNMLLIFYVYLLTCQDNAINQSISLINFDRARSAFYINHFLNPAAYLTY